MGQGGPQGQNSTLGGNPTRGNFDPAATGLSQSAAQAGVTRTPAPTYSASAIPASPGGKGGFPGGPASAPPASAPPASAPPASAPSFSSAPPASAPRASAPPASAPPASAPSFSSAPAPSPYAAALQAAIGGYMPRSPGGAPPPMAPRQAAAPPPASPGGKGGQQGQAPPRAETTNTFDARNASIQKVRDDQAAQAAMGYAPPPMAPPPMAPPPMAPPPMAPPPMAPPPMASPQGQQQPFQPPRVEAVGNFDARNARIKKVRDDQAAQRGLAGIYNNMNGFGF